MYTLANSRSTVAEHWPYHPEVKGSSLAVTAGTERVKNKKKI